MRRNDERRGRETLTERETEREGIFGIKLGSDGEQRKEWTRREEKRAQKRREEKGRAVERGGR